MKKYFAIKFLLFFAVFGLDFQYDYDCWTWGWLGLSLLNLYLYGTYLNKESNTKK